MPAKPKNNDAPTFQDVITRLNAYWSDRGCVLAQPCDIEVGAGTFNPATFLRSLGPEPFSVAYVEPCRRPTDGRYGDNPNRLQHYYQYQVLLKPIPSDIQGLYLGSLEAIGVDLKGHDIRFVEDDWESPTLGAWGLGWEVWCDGMEVTQYTYFQQVGGIELELPCVELTYGLERLCMYLQEVDSVYDLVWTRGPDGRTISYGDIKHRDEVEFSHFNFDVADVQRHLEEFSQCERAVDRCLSHDPPLVLPAYDQVMKGSHSFNLLDARGAISVSERQKYIGRVRGMARKCAERFVDLRYEMGLPLCTEQEREQAITARSARVAEAEKRLAKRAAKEAKAKAKLDKANANKNSAKNANTSKSVGA